MNKTFFLSFSLIVFCFFSNAQLNFTIDNAVVTGGVVSETIVSASKTYVFRATHSSGSGAMIFDNNVSGDFLFFNSNNIANSFWEITLTEDGNPISFNLNAFDYQSFSNFSYDITLTNNSGAQISPTQTISMVNSSNISFPITNMSNATGISSFRITGTETRSLERVDFHNFSLTPSTVLSISNFDVNQITFFKDPISGVYKLDFKESNKNYLISLFDIKGTKIRSFSTNNRKIVDVDLSTFKKGLYLLMVTDGKNRKVFKAIN